MSVIVKQNLRSFLTSVTNQELRILFQEILFGVRIESEYFGNVKSARIQWRWAWVKVQNDIWYLIPLDPFVLWNWIVKLRQVFLVKRHFISRLIYSCYLLNQCLGDLGCQFFLSNWTLTIILVQFVQDMFFLEQKGI